MSVASGRWPSAGFVAFCLVLAGAAAFFAWGLGTPPLERVWELHHLMKIGRVDRLDRGDRELLGEQFAAYPGLARDLLDGAAAGLLSAHRDGWIQAGQATLLRTRGAGGAGVLVLDVQAPPEALPLPVSVSGPGWSEQREVAAPGPIRVELPPRGAADEIIDIGIGGKGKGDDGSHPSVRITWEGAP